jgi:hypothetical protein
MKELISSILINSDFKNYYDVSKCTSSNGKIYYIKEKYQYRNNGYVRTSRAFALTENPKKWESCKTGFFEKNGILEK